MVARRSRSSGAQKPAWQHTLRNTSGCDPLRGRPILSVDQGASLVAHSYTLATVGDTSGIQGMSSFESWCECPKDIRGLPKTHASQGEDGPLARHRPGAFSPKERELQAGKPQAIYRPEVYPPTFTGALITISTICMVALAASSSRRLAKKLAGGARNPRSVVTGTTGCLSPYRAPQRWREKTRHLLALPPGRIILRQFTGGSARSSLHHRLMAFKLPA
jgi:hypothetical protein